MNKNRGLVITASDQITAGMTSEEQEKLQNEHKRRASNRKYVEGMFNLNGISTVVIHDVTRAVLAETIENTFSDADDQSTSYIYVNCHGSKSGLWLVLNGTSVAHIKFGDFKQLLDTIPGKVVLMIESCHSGESIAIAQRSLHKEMPSTPEDVNRAIISVFGGRNGNSRLRTGEFRSNKYLVITACHPDENAWGNNDGGYFTRLWCEGAGWDFRNSKASKYYADTNDDGFVSLNDLCNYTRKRSFWDNSKQQTVYQNDMCYPENNDTPVFPAPTDSESQAIEAYYQQHGGAEGVFQSAIGPVQKADDILYQDYAGGVIVQYPDGTVSGHTSLRYILKRIRQTGKINDGVGNHSLKLFIVVSMKHDDTWIEESKRWPEESKRKHGGKSFSIIYEGKAVTEEHAQKANVFYDTLTLKGESRIVLSIEVWNWDKSSSPDLITTYCLELDIKNGWGFDQAIPLPCASRDDDGSVVAYKDITTDNDNIKLDLSICPLQVFP